MNREQLANSPVWTKETRVATLNPGGGAVTDQPMIVNLLTVWTATGDNAALLTSGRPLGIMVSANTAAVTLKTGNTSAVGMTVAANTSLYVPVKNGIENILYDATAAFAVTVFFEDR
jgi:hypothetical protein